MSSETLRDFIRDEIKKQMTPTFLESLGQQLIIKTYIDSSVSQQLQSALQDNSGILSQFVQLHLPTALNKQRYFLDAINKQNKTFEKSLKQQEHSYRTAESKMMETLNDKAQLTALQTIQNLSNQNYVIQNMRHAITNDIKNEVNNDISNRIFRAYAISSIIGAGAGCALTFIIKSNL